MSSEEKQAGQAADAGTDAEKLAEGQAADAGTGTAAEETGKALYTPEELEALHPMDIDIERVDPAARKIVERTVGEYKALQGTYTKTSQELSELRKAPAAPEKFFDDPTMDADFKLYAKDPLNTVRLINARLRELRAKESNPETDASTFEQVRAQISYYEDIKDLFPLKKSEVAEARRATEQAEAQLKSEMGEDAPKIIDYAKTLGFSEANVRSNAELRSAVTRLYKAAHTGKEVKLKPPKLGSGSSGGASGGGSKSAEKMTAQEIYDAKARGENPYE